MDLIPTRVEPDAAHYSGRVTSRFTSIELDTVSMWERGCGFPRPGRTTAGSLLYSAYSEADVEAVRRITPALGHGYMLDEVVWNPVEPLGLFVTGAWDLEATKTCTFGLRETLPRRTRTWIRGAGGPAVGVRDDAVRIVAPWHDMDKAIAALPRSGR